MSLTENSSNVIKFPRPTFSVASKEWLKRTHTHPLLTDANKTVAAGLFLYFNYRHYAKTGELIAYPTWDRLSAEFGISKQTINESIELLERSRLLEVERGRYNRAAQKRARNLYRAVNTRFCEGQKSRPDQGQKSRQDSYDSPSTQGDYLDSERIENCPLDSVRKGSLPREEVKPRELTEEEIASLNRLAALPKRGRP
jgi:hypothetical protein